MNFKETLAEKTVHAEDVLTKYLPEEKGYQKKVIESMNYSVLAGGKRLRPILMEESFRLFGHWNALLSHCCTQFVPAKVAYLLGSTFGGKTPSVYRLLRLGAK